MIAVLIVAGWFLVETGASLPQKARFSLDLEALRAAAGPDEARPVEARAERVASAMMPAAAVMAGAGFHKIQFGFYVWQFRYTDGATAVIDAVHSHATHEGNHHGPDYNDAAWTRQEAAVAAARVMAATHEHYDHAGGFAESAHYAEFGDRLKLTEAQRRKARFGGGGDLSGPPTLASGPEGSIHPIAPGLVAVDVPGHTPGSQLIYVRLRGGRELLLIGDVVWQGFVLEREGSRPRLLSLIEDGDAVRHQTRAIIDFAKAHPEVDVVVAHDVAAMDARFRNGSVQEGLR